MSQKILSAEQAGNAAPGWRNVLGRLRLRVDCGDFATALNLVNHTARLAEQQNHHPDIDIRYSTVILSTVSHDVGGLTDRDVRLANAISDLVAEMGLSVRYDRIAAMEIAIDTMDPPAIKPFWLAVTGYREDDQHNLIDPDGEGPRIWFQQLDQPRPVRNRIHLDLNVAAEEAVPRVERALAAGGRLVSDAAAPSFWVLADADGNEICVCTMQNRD